MLTICCDLLVAEVLEYGHWLGMDVEAERVRRCSCHALLCCHAHVLWIQGCYLVVMTLLVQVHDLLAHLVTDPNPFCFLPASQIGAAVDSSGRPESTAT